MFPTDIFFPKAATALVPLLWWEEGVKLNEGEMGRIQEELLTVTTSIYTGAVLTVLAFVLALPCLLLGCGCFGAHLRSGRRIKEKALTKVVPS